MRAVFKVVHRVNNLNTCSFGCTLDAIVNFRNPSSVLSSTLFLAAVTVCSTTQAIAQPLTPPIDLPATLLPQGEPSPAPSPQFNLPLRRSSPLFENLTLTPNQLGNPTTVRGISGGALAAAQVAERAETETGPCLGFVDTQPDHILLLTESFNGLSLQVQSAEDTTLVIKGPGGSWCNDSYTSANPGIAGQWLPGTYNVWVGSQRSTGYFPYIIRIFEIEPPPGLPPIPTGLPDTESDGSSALPEDSSPLQLEDSSPLPSKAGSPDLPDVLPSDSPGNLPSD